MATSEEDRLEREAQLAARDRGRAAYQLRRVGLRLMTIEGETLAGIWSDLDNIHVRPALAIFGMDGTAVRYLDGPDIPLRFKTRRVPGTPVPASVLEAMREAQAAGEAPWKVRDRLLEEMDYRPVPAPYPVELGGRPPMPGKPSPPLAVIEEHWAPPPPPGNVTALTKDGLRVWIRHASDRWLIYHEVKTKKGGLKTERRRGFQTITRDHAKRVAYLWYEIPPEAWEEEKK